MSFCAMCLLIDGVRLEVPAVTIFEGNALCRGHAEAYSHGSRASQNFDLQLLEECAKARGTQ